MRVEDLLLQQAIPLESTLRAAELAQIEGGTAYLMIVEVARGVFSNDQKKAFARHVGELFHRQFGAGVVVIFNDAGAKISLYRIGELDLESDRPGPSDEPPKGGES